MLAETGYRWSDRWEQKGVEKSLQKARAVLLRNRGDRRQSASDVVVAEFFGAATTELVGPLEDEVGRAKTAGPIGLLEVLPGKPGRSLDLLGVWVTSLSEQRHHLRLGDLHSNRKIRHTRKAASHPDARSFALLAVVVAEAPRTTLGGVVRSHLTGQIRVPVARRELMNRHHKLTLGSPVPHQDHPRVHEVCSPAILIAALDDENLLASGDAVYTLVRVLRAR